MNRRLKRRPTEEVQNAECRMQSVLMESVRLIPVRTLFTLHSKLFTYMVRPLRQRHRIVVLALSAFLPVAFVLGIASRRSVPLIPALPSGLSAQAGQISQSVWVRDDLWEKKPLRTRLLSDPLTSNLALEVTATTPVVLPDVLLYWAPGTSKVDDLLPGDAVLLGEWMQESANPVAVPRPAKVLQGRLILYSLADHEIVNVSKPFAFQDYGR
jgi:hypothetical protein